MGLIQSIRNLFQSNTRPTRPTADEGGVVLYTLGDTVYDDAVAFRGAMEREFRLMMRGASGVSDYTLAEAVKLVVPARVCIEYRVDVISQLPITVTDPEGEPLDDHPLTYFEYMSPEIVAKAERALCVWGKAQFAKIANEDKQLTGLRFLHPNHTTEHVDGDGFIVEYVDNITRERYTPDQVVDIRLFDYAGDGSPLSPLENAFLQANISRSIAEHAATFFFNSALVAGVLTFDNPMTDTQYKEARREWRKNFRGVSNSHKAAVLPAGAKWTPMQSAPKDLAMTDLSDQAKQEICAAFGVDPALVGLGDVSDPLSALSTKKEARKAFVQTVGIARARFIARKLTQQWTHKDFPPYGYYTLMVIESRSPSDTPVEEINATNALLKEGVIDYAEQRAQLGYAGREPEGDELTIRRHPGQPMEMFRNGAITYNQMQGMIGLPALPIDLIRIDDVTYAVTDIQTVVQANVDNISREPQPVPSMLPTGNVPPQLQASNDDTAEPLDDDTEADQPPTRRNNLSVVLAVDFAGHQFVRYARRMLGERIDARKWVEDSQWRLELLAMQASPRSVASILRGMDLSDADKVDVWTAGYLKHEGDIYLAIEMSDALERFQQSLSFDMTMTIDATPNMRNVAGIKLCHAPSADESALLTDQRYPLVINNVTLYANGQAQNRWALRGMSPSALKELRTWRKIIHDRGRDYDFTPEALQGSPVVPFVRWGMSAGANTDRLFDVATDMLTGRADLIAIDDGGPVKTEQTRHILEKLVNHADS